MKASKCSSVVVVRSLCRGPPALNVETGLKIEGRSLPARLPCRLFVGKYFTAGAEMTPLNGSIRDPIGIVIDSKIFQQGIPIQHSSIVDLAVFDPSAVIVSLRSAAGRSIQNLASSAISFSFL